MNINLPFDLSDEKKELLKSSGHILALGGPGSGKTTIALLKAKSIIKAGLRPSQFVLFLSFARATVARVDQQSKNIIDKATRKNLEINTYHGFAWKILKAHGYLLNNGVKLRLLPPPEAASRLAEIEEKEQRSKEKDRLFIEEGLIHFDLFAGLTAELLSRSNSLLEMISKVYPVIILDEFQDTNSEEWKIIQLLGKKSLLISLADIDQRIYEFRGADPARVSEFIKMFEPHEFDFATENNRSNGTDIAQFGNDLLTGSNLKKVYQSVHIKRYGFQRNQGIHTSLKTEIFEAFKRLQKEDKKDWSIALLVPSKKLMISVSDFLSAKQLLGSGRSLPAINHEVAFEMAGPSLAAILIARLLDRGASDEQLQLAILNDLFEHIRGRNGDVKISQSNLTLSNAIKTYISSGKIQGPKRKLIVAEALRIARECREMIFTGNPVTDWVSVRNVLSASTCEPIKQVANDAVYLRLLRKGALVSSGLSGVWRTKGNYEGATSIIRNALTQEHFVASMNTWKGLHVMTMHKAKGKEFDEVIIFEGTFAGKIVRSNATENEYNQSRLALRVAVTRAMKRTTIITPGNDPCPFVYQ